MLEGRRQEGNALLLALFVVSLVAIAAMAMSRHLRLDTYRLSLSIESDRLYLAAEGLRFWAMDGLTKAPLIFMKEEGRVLLYSKDLDAFYPDLKLEAKVYDLQGRFNLNLIDERLAYPLFIQLLRKILASNEGGSLAQVLLHWRKPYLVGYGQDELDSYYLQQKPPYQASHQALADATELRLLKGVNANIYQALNPFVTALPGITPININTASKPLLASLSPSMDEEKVEELIALRPIKDKKGKQKLKLLLQKLKIPEALVTTESEYFLCVAKVSSSDLSLVSHTVLRRTKDKKGKFRVGVISQTLNT